MDVSYGERYIQMAISIAFHEERFLRAKDIRSRYSISDPTLHRWTKSGKLPTPEYLNGQRVWRQSVIEAAEQKMLDSADRMPNRIGA